MRESFHGSHYLGLPLLLAAVIASDGSAEAAAAAASRSGAC